MAGFAHFTAAAQTEKAKIAGHFQFEATNITSKKTLLWVFPQIPRFAPAIFVQTRAVTCPVICVKWFKCGFQKQCQVVSESVKKSVRQRLIHSQ